MTMTSFLGHGFGARKGADGLLIPWLIDNKTSFLPSVYNAETMLAQKTPWQPEHWLSDYLTPHSKGGKEEKA